MDGVKIKVPATSANLGPGFDCLGIALNLYNRLEVHEDERLHIESEGEGAASIPGDASNLIYRAMRRAYAAAGRTCPGFFIRQVCSIPLDHGLGSSAAAIVGGLVAANALMGSPLTKHELARLACSIEGHPDNVVPCLFGGLAASGMDNGDVQYALAQPHARYRFAAIVPGFDLPTKTARQALPDTYPKADAVYNVGRAVLTYAALTQGDTDLLAAACRDRLHQPYRKTLIPGWDDVNACAKDSGAVTVFLSGAGPTVMAVFDCEDEGFPRRLQDAVEGLTQHWKILRLECCADGTTVKHGG